jgi:hypothetical protein
MDRSPPSGGTLRRTTRAVGRAGSNLGLAPQARNRNYPNPSRRTKSFADDLNTEPGIVRSRVTLLLRSSEIKPCVLEICFIIIIIIIVFFFFF